MRKKLKTHGFFRTYGLSFILLLTLVQCDNPFKRKSKTISFRDLEPEMSFSSSHELFKNQGWDVFSGSGDYLYSAGENDKAGYSITRTLIKGHEFEIDTIQAIAGLNKDCQYEIYLVRGIDAAGLVSICIPKVFEEEEQHWMIKNSEPIHVVFYYEALDELKRYHITGYNQDTLEDLLENGTYPKPYCDAYSDKNDTLKFSWNVNAKCQITANSFKLYASDTHENCSNNFQIIKTLYPGEDLIQNDNDSFFMGSVSGAYGPRLYIFNDSLNRLFSVNMDIESEDNYFHIEPGLNPSEWVCPFNGGFYIMNRNECRRFKLDE